MTKTVACLMTACVTIAAGAAVPATSAQDRTAYPGEPTRGKVWIQNRGNAEAVPVTIWNMDDGAPILRVQVSGTPTVTIGNANVPVKAARQPWEYRAITVASGLDLTAALNAAGTDGWETTGITMPAPSGVLVLMKRPR
jgi:hypothetical protein